LRHIPHGAAGPDGLTSKIISGIAPLIAKPLFIMYQQSVFNGLFPDKWKTARITPIYKGKGQHKNPDSYRPVSLCDLLGKCLERIVNNQMTKHIEDNHMLCDVQHGFREGKSTITNLLITDKLIAEWTNKGIPFDIISFDMSKAFNRVPHEMIVHLLRHLGFAESIVMWFQSFLDNRTQYVRVGAALSPELSVTSGIIQGSVVGPCLWNLFINQVANLLHVRFVLYADDFKFLFNLHEINNSAAQEVLNTFTSWCHDNFVQLNIDKSCCLHSSDTNGTTYTCDNKALPVVESFKDLGVVRSADGSYTLHAEYTASKGQRISAIISKNIIIPNYSIGWKIFQVYVLPILSYGSLVWNNGANSILENVQRRYTKKLRGLRRLDYNKRLQTMQILSLAASRNYNDMLFAFKLINNHSNSNFNLSDFGFTLSNRSRSPQFVLELVNRESVRQFARFRIPSKWNSLPAYTNLH
jgi:hypothetical protein